MPSSTACANGKREWPVVAGTKQPLPLKWRKGNLSRFLSQLRFGTFPAGIVRSSRRWLRHRKIAAGD
jgi:hypothetical protein